MAQSVRRFFHRLCKWMCVCWRERGSEWENTCVFVRHHFLNGLINQLFMIFHNTCPVVGIDGRFGVWIRWLGGWRRFSDKAKKTNKKKQSQPKVSWFCVVVFFFSFYPKSIRFFARYRCYLAFLTLPIFLQYPRCWSNFDDNILYVLRGSNWSGRILWWSGKERWDQKKYATEIKQWAWETNNRMKSSQKEVMGAQHLHPDIT